MDRETRIKLRTQQIQLRQTNNSNGTRSETSSDSRVENTTQNNTTQDKKGCGCSRKNGRG